MDDTYYIIAGVVLAILFIIALFVMYIKRRKAAIYSYTPVK